MAAVLDQPLELTETEIVRMTGYKRPTKQIESLKSLGIPARKRPDNSVLVLRVHCLYPIASPERIAADKPKLKPIARKK
ncbi:DUF4224 domain-containing protein [Paraburkholderia sp. CNPSo 3157]|uniref:DUF4224 domain-containing protein n=1 Tax=Paraburkholderia franconis TaxID=2654983 RepID=A0A7X1TF74_9BURK|nr:DUF4224 domain-containing protein [Paraburkholderia franconis]MPW16961.1 DUF4224 domain-containing protein [Paraburkholderia franconis]